MASVDTHTPATRLQARRRLRRRPTIDTRVMTHPSRVASAARLAASISADLVTDPDPAGPPSALRTALAAWSRPGRGSHRLVIQDDALLCTNFLQAVRRVLVERPESLVAFYVGGAHPGGYYYQTAARRCERYADLPLHHFVPTVCLAAPTAWADDWVGWVREHLDDGYAYDDEAWRMWREAQPIPPSAVATVPCLAQHSNTGASIIGHAHHGYRQAACFVGAYDPLEVWT